MRLKLSLALVLAIAPSLLLADRGTERLLSQMRDAYRAVKSAHFSVESMLDGPTGKLSLSSDVLYAAPDKLRAKVSGFPEGSPVQELVVISDGKEIATLGAPGGTRKKEFSTDGASSRLGYANLETLCFWDYAKQLSTAKGDNMAQSTLKILPDEEMDGKKYVVLEEFAPDQKVLVHYWIDPKSHLIWRALTKGSDTQKVIGDSKITKLEIDVTIDESNFKIVDVL